MSAQLEYESGAMQRMSTLPEASQNLMNSPAMKKRRRSAFASLGFRRSGKRRSAKGHMIHSEERKREMDAASCRTAGKQTSCYLICFVWTQGR